MKSRRRLAFAMLATIVTLNAPAHAQDNTFYQGKTVRVIVGSATGGSSGSIGQMLAQHIGKHIPGRPAVIPQYMPGAGGTVAMNFVYNAAPKDGTAIGLYLPGVLIAELLSPGEVRYKSSEIQWVGRVLGYTSVLSVMKDAPATTIAEAQRSEIIIAATGRSSPAYQEPVLAAAALNLRLKFLFGYTGSAEMTLAMERGEAHGRIMASNAWEAQRPEWITAGRLAHLVQIGPGDQQRMPNVPKLLDLATTDRGRELAKFAEIGPRTGWGAYLAPGVPDFQVGAIRSAFRDTLADPGFRSDLQRALKADAEPLHWEDLSAYVRDVLATPDDVKAEISRIFGAAN